MKRSVSIVGFICFTLFFVSLSGCGTWNISPEHTYLKTLRHFNNTIETYEQHYQMQTPEIQIKWKKQIDPLVKVASTALNDWGIAISNPQAELNYRTALGELIQALFDIGIIEIKEK